MIDTYPIQFNGSKLAKWLLHMLGWRLLFRGLPAPRGVIVVYPHTSNWDFCIGILGKWAMGIELKFLAKDSLFSIPVLGSWLRFLGGLPVDRSSPQGYIDDLAKMMSNQPYSWILFTPEGTRKYTPGWRSGFYRLAIKAKVPIGMAIIDYSAKEIGIEDFFIPTGTEEIDLKILREMYCDRVGCRPELAAPITFWSPSKKE